LDSFHSTVPAFSRVETIAKVRNCQNFMIRNYEHFMAKKRNEFCKINLANNFDNKYKIKKIYQTEKSVPRILLNMQFNEIIPV